MIKNTGFTTIDTFTIQSLFKKFQKDRLFLRPLLKEGRRTFQRLPHKGKDWKIFLIHCLLRGTTLPAIYLYQDAEDEAILHIVDGQQRLSAIFEFMLGGFRLSKAGMLKGSLQELPDEFDKCYWSDLSKEAQDRFKNVLLRVECINDPTQPGFDKLIRQTFHDYNITSTSMTSMEIWNSAYNGDFVDTLYEIKEGLGFISPGTKDLMVSKSALENYVLLNHKIVSKTDVLRLQDMDLILSLMIAMVRGGPQHKDEGLAELCNQYQKMDAPFKQRLIQTFMENMGILNSITEKLPSMKFCDTELRKKHDFYSLFCAIDNLRREEGLDAGDNMEVIAHNLEAFNIYLRSYLEYIQGVRNKTVTEWDKVQTLISVAMKKAIPEYYNSRTRDWNHNSKVSPSRSIRMNILLDIMSRRNKLPTV